MQHEVTRPQHLLSDAGVLNESGWARSEVWAYNWEQIKAPWFRIKEWDYYLFTTEHFGIAFTISDLGYIGLLSASFVDFDNGTEHTESDLEFFPKGKKYGLGASVIDGDAHCRTKRMKLSFSMTDKGRKITLDFPEFNKAENKSLSAELFITEENMEPLYIASSWDEDRHSFYYNCKKNCLSATGKVEYGTKRYLINKGECYGGLDWGRGVWTFDNTWYWGTGNGLVNGEIFALNLGYGFSNRSQASENALYYKGKIHKLENVTMKITEDGNGNRLYTEPWTVTSDDNRLEGIFIPILDRSATIDLKLIISVQHQVFGRFTGKAVMDDGEVLEIKDFICSLEVVRNKY